MAWSLETYAIGATSVVVASIGFLYVWDALHGGQFFRELTKIFGGDTKKQISDETLFPEARRPRIVHEKSNFKKICYAKIKVGKDNFTGKDMYRFRYDDGKLTDFTAIDSPIFLRQENLIAASTSDIVPEWKVVDDDELTRIYNEKLASDGYAKAMMQENIDLKTGQKQLAKETIEHQKGMRDIAYGASPNPYGYQSPHGQNNWNKFSRNRGRPTQPPMGGGDDGSEHQQD